MSKILPTNISTNYYTVNAVNAAVSGDNVKKRYKKTANSQKVTMVGVNSVNIEKGNSASMEGKKAKQDTNRFTKFALLGLCALGGVATYSALRMSPSGMPGLPLSNGFNSSLNFTSNLNQSNSFGVDNLNIGYPFSSMPVEIEPYYANYLSFVPPQIQEDSPEDNPMVPTDHIDLDIPQSKRFISDDLVLGLGGNTTASCTSVYVCRPEESSDMRAVNGAESKTEAVKSKVLNQADSSSVKSLAIVGCIAAGVASGNPAVTLVCATLLSGNTLI